MNKKRRMILLLIVIAVLAIAIVCTIFLISKRTNGKKNDKTDTEQTTVVKKTELPKQTETIKATESPKPTETVKETESTQTATVENIEANTPVENTFPYVLLSTTFEHLAETYGIGTHDTIYNGGDLVYQFERLSNINVIYQLEDPFAEIDPDLLPTYIEIFDSSLAVQPGLQIGQTDSQALAAIEKWDRCDCVDSEYGGFFTFYNYGQYLVDASWLLDEKTLADFPYPGVATNQEAQAWCNALLADNPGTIDRIRIRFKNLA